MTLTFALDLDKVEQKCLCNGRLVIVRQTAIGYRRTHRTDRYAWTTKVVGEDPDKIAN